MFTVFLRSDLTSLNIILTLKNGALKEKLDLEVKSILVHIKEKKKTAVAAHTDKLY